MSEYFAPMERWKWVFLASKGKQIESISSLKHEFWSNLRNKSSTYHKKSPKRRIAGKANWIIFVKTSSEYFYITVLNLKFCGQTVTICRVKHETFFCNMQHHVLTEIGQYETPFMTSYRRSKVTQICRNVTK